MTCITMVAEYIRYPTRSLATWLALTFNALLVEPWCYMLLALQPRVAPLNAIILTDITLKKYEIWLQLSICSTKEVGPNGLKHIF